MNVSQMPAGVSAVPEAAAAWKALADMVPADANVPVVNLPKDDTRNLDLLTTLGGALVEPTVDGGRKVTLMVETAQPQSEASNVKEAAAAQSKFAGQEPRE